LKRTLFFVISDILIITLSIYLAFLLRFDNHIPAQHFDAIKSLLFASYIVIVPTFYMVKLYSFSWSFISTKDLVNLIKGLSFSYIIISLLLYSSQSFHLLSGFPRSTLIISYLLILFFTGALRLAKRLISQELRTPPPKERTLIVGAGESGEQLLRSLINNYTSPYNPIGFVDDNPMKLGVLIHGLKVFGRIDQLPKIIKNNHVDNIIIALASDNSQTIKRAVELARNSGIKKIKIVPTINEVLHEKIAVHELRDVKVDDLLGRKKITLDTHAISSFIHNKTVLITGGSGSIGSELAVQISKFHPEHLIVIDQDETGIFNIRRKLLRQSPDIKAQFVIADVRNQKKINQLFTEYKPQVVFHAAAYKHVPLMESHPEEAVINNIFGTYNLARLSQKHQVESFVFISTDKAVNPTSVMGSSKRVGEMICQKLSESSQTKFMSVRFGNVLGSRGSVIPIFKEQIKRGGPVEITHPDMKRYFMLTSEAVLLVMQAGSMGLGGEVFVLDMGQPVKIIDLAKELIRLNGFEPDRDIPIIFTGIRKGEKLFEELLTAEEGTISTSNNKIFQAKLSPVVYDNWENHLAELLNYAKENNKEAIVNKLKFLIPTYKNDNHQ